MPVDEVLRRECMAQPGRLPVAEALTSVLVAAVAGIEVCRAKRPDRTQLLRANPCKYKRKSPSRMRQILWAIRFGRLPQSNGAQYN
jgi:hypothetical protein